jgi:hypothetical protein
MNKKQLRILIVVIVAVVLVGLVMMFGASLMSGLHKIPLH